MWISKPQDVSSSTQSSFWVRWHFLLTFAFENTDGRTYLTHTHRINENRKTYSERFCEQWSVKIDHSRRLSRSSLMNSQMRHLLLDKELWIQLLNLVTLHPLFVVYQQRYEWPGAYTMHKTYMRSSTEPDAFREHYFFATTFSVWHVTFRYHCQSPLSGPIRGCFLFPPPCGK